HYLGFFAGRGYTGYALNLRGHHGSKPVDDIGRVRFADYLADARAAAAAIGNPIIVGHSMGGLLAQKLAELGEPPAVVALTDRKSTRLNSSHVSISYAVFCLKK